MPPTSSLPPLPRGARYRSSLIRTGTPTQPWSYLPVPRSDRSRLGGFAEVQALARDVVTLGVRHTALVQCRPDRTIVGVVLDPPHEVSLRIAVIATPGALEAPEIVVVEVSGRLTPVVDTDLDGLAALRSIMRRQGLRLVDVVRTDGDLVISLSIAGGLADPWRSFAGAVPTNDRRGR